MEVDPAKLICPVPHRPDDVVLLGHGSGGRLSDKLVREVFLEAFDNPVLARLDDQAVLEIGGQRIAFSTDSFVVKPLFFPGGNIGKLAVHGTVNDLAMGGARPICLSAAFIIEEGLPMDVLRRVVASLQEAAALAGIDVVTGDTKVVERGGADGLFINTTGIGIVAEGVAPGAHRARPGDRVLLSGSLGDHGIAVLAQREGLEFESEIESDSAALHELVAALLVVSKDVHCMRDPTRGGLSSTLNEIASQSGVGIEIDERVIPIDSAVQGACEVLGLDPLSVANEGKLVAIVEAEVAEEMLTALRGHPLGARAEIIGTVMDTQPGVVRMRTRIGTTRIVDMLAGDQLPRIC